MPSVVRLDIAVTNEGAKPDVVSPKSQKGSGSHLLERPLTAYGDWRRNSRRLLCHFHSKNILNMACYDVGATKVLELLGVARRQDR